MSREDVCSTAAKPRSAKSPSKMSGEDPATKKKPNKGVDVKKKIADLASELSKIQKELDKTKDGNKKRGTKDLESGGLTNILNSLARSMEVVKVLLENQSEDNCPRVKMLEDKTRVLEDSNDLQQQKMLKGKFMITAPRNKDSIASEAKLREENKSLPKYISELVFNKLGQTIKEEEIVSCYHTTNGGLMFRLANFKPGSGYQRVVSAIKGGAGKDVPDLYVNFALTRRRAALLYEVRQLKKAQKIPRFLSDADGSITVVLKDGAKMRVTNYVNKAKDKEDASPLSTGKTFTKEELWDHFSA